MTCSGLPPWHKYVVEQGYPPEEAEAAIKNSTRIMVERGYNVKSMSLFCWTCQRDSLPAVR